MRKMVSIIVVLLMLLQVALVAGQGEVPKGVIDIPKFSNGSDVVEIVIEDDTGNSSAGVIVPANGYVTAAKFTVEALDHYHSMPYHLHDNVTFNEFESKRHEAEIADDNITSKKIYGNLGMAWDDFSNGTYNGLEYDDFLRLTQKKEVWEQKGFGGGPDLPGPTDSPDSEKFSSSSNIDHSTSGSAKLIPGYRWEAWTGGGSPPEVRGKMAYTLDGTGTKMHIYGGDTPWNMSYEDYYILDLQSNSWTSKCNSCMPGYLSNATFVWDTVNSSVVLSGGVDDMGWAIPLSWEFDGNMWIMGPDIQFGRYSHAEVYVKDSNESFIFGGIDSMGVERNSILVRSDNTWTDKTGSYSGDPGSRINHTGVYDPVHDQIIFFGGQDKVGTNPLAIIDILHLDINTWSRPVISHKPAPRYGHTAVWDPVASGMIIYGGSNGNTVLDDAWIYWPANNTWRKLPSSSHMQWEHAAVWTDYFNVMYAWGGYRDPSGSTQNNNMKLVRDFKGEGEVISTAFDASIPVQWEQVSFDVNNIVPETNVEVFLRVGDDPDLATGWTNWMGPYDEGSNDLAEEGVPSTRYAQWRAVLTSTKDDITPVLNNVTVTYRHFVNNGNMVTVTHDLEITPSSWDNFTIAGKYPPNTAGYFKIHVAPEATGPWDSFVFSDNTSLRDAPVGRYVKFDIYMETSNLSQTPEMYSLDLGYVFYSDWGFFHLSLPVVEKPLDRLYAEWTGGTPDGSHQPVVSISMDNGVTWTQLMNSDTWYPPAPSDPLTHNLLVNVSLVGPGRQPVIFDEIFIELFFYAQPEDVNIDVGDDGKGEWSWTGTHSSGDTEVTHDLSNPFNEYLKSNQDEADAEGKIFIPLAVDSASPCKLLLKGLSVTVEVDNRLPNIVSDPPTKAFVGYEYTYEIDARDEEPDPLNYSLDIHPDGMRLIADDEPVYIIWTPDTDDLGIHAIEITVDDGYGEVHQRFSINVTDEKVNNPPYFVSIPPEIDMMRMIVEVEEGTQYEYRVSAIDEDMEDNLLLKITLEAGPSTMTYDGTNNVLRWTPAHSDVGDHIIILKVTDGKGSDLQTFGIKVIPEPNDPPQIKQKVPDTMTAKEGEPFKYVLDVTDEDGDLITFALEGAPAWLTIDDNGRITGTPGKDDVGEFTFTIVVSDGKEDLRPTTTLTVEKKGTIGGIADDDLMGLLLIILIIVIIIIVVVAVVVSKRKKAKAAGPIVPAEPHIEKPRPKPAPPKRAPARPPARAKAGPPATVAAAATSAAAPTAAAAAAKACEKPIIEEVYLIYNDGRMIAHETRRLSPDMDEVVLSGMLRAITDFVKDSFRKEGSLGGLDYGEFRIMIESGAHATLALVICGTESTALREELRRTLEKIQGLYSGVIEDWDGDTSHFKDVKKYLQPIILMGRTLEEDAEMGEVRVMSALEFYQGYVRIKVAIKNKYPFMIHDVTLKTIYDKKALALSHIEPEYDMEGAEVMIGNIPPKEKKTVAFYLDPLICMESNIDASVMYKNYKGEIKTSMMKRRPVDIVCPIFYTEHNVNVAMLKRLINELKYRDSKIYTLPKTLTPEQAIGLAKETVQSHDVKFVREFSEDDPFIGEAWFYGKTKTTLEDLVIRATVRADSNTLELFVSSSNLATLPGLLADLAHGLKRRYTRQKKGKDKLIQVTDTKVKDSLEKSKLLIEKYASTEMDPESDEMDL